MTRFDTVFHKNMAIFLPIRDGITSPLIHQGISEGWYEMEEGRLARKILSSEDVVLELGGGLGCLMSYICLNVKPLAYFCIEADERLIRFIQAALATNNVAASGVQLSVHNLVLTNTQACLEKGSTAFYVRDEFWISSTINNENFMRPYTSVAVRDFNEFVNLNNVSALICDIEGGEVDIFCAGRELPNSINKVVVEIHPEVIGDHKAEEVVSIIADQGFSMMESLQNGTARICSFSRPSST